MAREPMEPATAAPAVTGTEVVAVLLEVWEAPPVVPVTTVARLVVAVVLPAAVVVPAAVVAPVVAPVVAAVVPAAVVARVVAAAEEEAAEEEEPLLEPAAATAAQNLEAAGRTSLAATAAVQALTTQVVAAPWMAFWLELVHWQV
jgi:hypothetical protein